MINRTTLSGALAKINQLQPGEKVDFSEAELAALFAFADGTVGQDLACSRRRDFVARVNALVADLPRPEYPPITEERRRNELLRAAMDQLHQGNPITESERNLILGTLDHLKGRSDLDEDERRLHDIIETSMGIKSEAPPQPDITGAEVHTDIEGLFANAEKEMVPDLDGIPLGKVALVRRVVGSVELEAPLPEGHLLRVEQGTALIHGNVGGVLWVDGDISVRGDVIGGMAVSNQGSVSAGRAAGGAVVIARHGNVALSQCENAQRLFAAGECSVDGDVFTSSVVAQTFEVGGLVRDSECQVLDRFSARDMAESANGQNRIVFRRLLLPSDYRAPDEDDAVNLLRTALRAQYRIDTGEAWSNALIRERNTAHTTILYTLRAGAQTTPTPQALRNAQVLHIYLGLLIRLCEDGHRYLLRAADVPQEALKLLFATAADDLQSTARNFEKEIELVPEELARTAKPAILQAGRHLMNTLKKAKEAVALGKPADGPFEALDKRLAEWHAQLASASESLDAVQREADQVLGPAAKASPEQMERLVNSALAEGGPKATGGIMRMMRSGLERIGPAKDKWDGVVTAAHLEFLSARDRLEKDYGIAIAHGTTAPEAVSANWGSGVAVHPLRPRDPAVSHWGIATTDPNTPPGTIFRLDGFAAAPVPPKDTESGA